MATGSSRLTRLPRAVPLAIDVATIAGMTMLAPWLGDRIFAQSPVTRLFLLPGFLLIIVGIVAIRSLPAYTIDDRKAPSLLAVCLAFFMAVTYSLLYAHATNIAGTEAGNDNAAFLIFLVLIVAIVVASVWPLQKATPDSAKALGALTVGLISVNYLTLIGVSVSAHFSTLPTSSEPVYATGISFLILYAILYVLFLALFGLPRLYLLRATGDKLGLTIYLVGIAISLWDKVPPVN